MVVWAVGTALLMLGWMRAATQPQLIATTSPMLRGGHRRLQLQQAYTVDLFLALFYVNEAIAIQLQGNEIANPLVAAFCGAINAQVRTQSCLIVLRESHSTRRHTPQLVSLTPLLLSSVRLPFLLDFQLHRRVVHKSARQPPR
jgi:hypothetical protein